MSIKNFNSNIILYLNFYLNCPTPTVSKSSIWTMLSSYNHLKLIFVSKCKFYINIQLYIMYKHLPKLFLSTSSSEYMINLENQVYNQNVNFTHIIHNYYVPQIDSLKTVPYCFRSTKIPFCKFKKVFTRILIACLWREESVGPKFEYF